MRRPARSARGCGAACCIGSRGKVGATKIALGHHLDDFVETLLLNLFFAGALKAMPARLVSDNGAHVVIRPLVYVTEAEARAYARENDLPIIGCCCPACGDLSLQRQRVKRLILELEREHPNVKSSMIKALGNVMPRHLLDRRLNPVRDLENDVGVAASTTLGDVPPDVPLIPLLTVVGPGTMRSVVQRVRSRRGDGRRPRRRRRSGTVCWRSSAWRRAMDADDVAVCRRARFASCGFSRMTATPPAASG